MSGILAEFVEKIISLKDPTIIEVAGQQYANQEFARIKPHVDRPSMYEVTGLDSIVQLLRKEIERVGGFAFVRVAGHARTCGVERTYQRHRELSPLSLDAARAAELGLSYGQYKAREVV